MPYRSKFLKFGRSIKSALRLGCHSLRCSSAVVNQNARRVGRSSSCPCCDVSVLETIEHTLLDCSEFSNLRQEFFRRVERVVPGFTSAPHDAKLRFMLSEVSIKGLDVPLYYFLSSVFTHRAKLILPFSPNTTQSHSAKLVDLTRPGENTLVLAP